MTEFLNLKLLLFFFGIFSYNLKNRNMRSSDLTEKKRNSNVSNRNSDNFRIDRTVDRRNRNCFVSFFFNDNYDDNENDDLT